MHGAVGIRGRGAVEHDRVGVDDDEDAFLVGLEAARARGDLAALGRLRRLDVESLGRPGARRAGLRSDAVPLTPLPGAPRVSGFQASRVRLVSARPWAANVATPYEPPAVSDPGRDREGGRERAVAQCPRLHPAADDPAALRRHLSGLPGGRAADVDVDAVGGARSRVAGARDVIVVATEGSTRRRADREARVRPWPGRPGRRGRPGRPGPPGRRAPRR